MCRRGHHIDLTTVGLDVTNPDSGEVNVVATAAVEAFLSTEMVRARV